MWASDEDSKYKPNQQVSPLKIMTQDAASDCMTKEVRIFMDGAFDMMHFGHMNAFRWGRSLGTYLVVGVNSDKSITECKGPPLMNDHERLTMVQSCKFVDEVIPDCPYIMDADYVNWVIDTYKIDYVVHGDDPCIVNGKDVYEAAKAAGKFRSIPRTHGISTTDIVGRMLVLAKTRPLEDHKVDNLETTPDSATSSIGNVIEKTSLSASSTSAPLCQRSKFLATSRILRLFSSNDTLISDADMNHNMRTIYIDGSWDLFHPGHVAMLEAAKKVQAVVPCTD
jgi:ethanolamine-phosphate cytidylyltransferase